MASKVASQMTENGTRGLRKRCIILVTASLLCALLFWNSYLSICAQISSNLVGFERDPPLGRDYWWWFFFKQDFDRVVRSLTIPAVFAAVLVWKWVAFIRDVRRK